MFGNSCIISFNNRAKSQFMETISNIETRMVLIQLIDLVFCIQSLKFAESTNSKF